MQYKVVSNIQSKILMIRGLRVIIDKDLAELYRVETRVLNQAVRRNIKRFPKDFMFQLTIEEAESSRSQNVTLKRGYNIKYLPYAFTEQGVAMLSSVLNSERAIEVNILIMRAFVRLRRLVLEHDNLRKIIENIEKRLDLHDRQIAIAFSALKSFLQPSAQEIKTEYAPDSKKRMGFRKE